MEGMREEKGRRLVEGMGRHQVQAQNWSTELAALANGLAVGYKKGGVQNETK